MKSHMYVRFLTISDLVLTSARIFWSRALAGLLVATDLSGAFSGALSGVSAMTKQASIRPANRANNRRGIAFLLVDETRGYGGLNPRFGAKLRASYRPPRTIAINYRPGYAGFITSRDFHEKRCKTQPR